VKVKNIMKQLQTCQHFYIFGRKLVLRIDMDNLAEFAYFLQLQGAQPASCAKFL